MSTEKRILREKHTVPHLQQKMRLSDYLPEIFQILPSRKGIKKAIKQGDIYINDKVGHTSDWLYGSEEIFLFYSVNIGSPVFPKTLKILFEDDIMAAVNKPAGIMVSGNRFQTLEHALPYNLTKSSLPDALPRILPVHRLDFPTSGILLVAKTGKALRHLKNQFEQREIEKYYLAITHGVTQEEGIITKSLDGKESISRYTRLQYKLSKKYNDLSLLLVKPATGRMHQIRKHLLYIGHPVVGDQKYNLEKYNPFPLNQLHLCAAGISFQHPQSENKIFLQVPPPRKFRRFFPDTPAISEIMIP